MEVIRYNSQKIAQGIYLTKSRIRQGPSLCGDKNIYLTHLTWDKLFEKYRSIEKENLKFLEKVQNQVICLSLISLFFSGGSCMYMQISI